ncbi:MAG TPA: hypothetical protein VL551_33695 [Actinospica sp.]|jgi:hypothetical protein|nr:hypothetical protein [Actinospica sp.]
MSSLADQRMKPLIDFLAQRTATGEPPAADLDLIENRILDSLAVVEFLLLIEECSGRPASLTAVSAEDLRTLRSIERSFFG